MQKGRAGLLSSPYKDYCQRYRVNAVRKPFAGKRLIVKGICQGIFNMTYSKKTTVIFSFFRLMA
jgi:hypothetical protein